jgi:DNA-binding NarL/FixJ family response regulator
LSKTFIRNSKTYIAILSSMQPLHFLLADDHAVVRGGLRAMLEKNFDGAMITEAVNGIEAIEAVRQHKINVAFLDFSMPKMDGFEAAQLMLKENRNIRIIVLTLYDDIPVILNFFKIGAKGFLTKTAREKEIKECVESALRNDYYYHTRFESSIAQWLGTRMEWNIPSIQFSKREMEIVLKIAKGLTNAEIGQQLETSPRTIESTRAHLLKKAMVKNTAELIEFVFNNGIISPGTIKR